MVEISNRLYIKLKRNMKYFILCYREAPVGDSHDSKLEYDFTNACHECGTGARLVGNLKLIGINKLKKDFFETYMGDYVLSERLLNFLKTKNIISEELKNVCNSKNMEQPYYHLYTNVTLPPAIKKEGLATDDQCPICKRNGFFSKLSKQNGKTTVLPSGIVYSTSQISKMGSHHFFLTWECFGYSNPVAHGNNEVGFARPLIVVSECFKNAIEDFKVKGVEFKLIEVQEK